MSEDNQHRPCNLLRSVVNMYLQHWRVPKNLFLRCASEFPQAPLVIPRQTDLGSQYGFVELAGV
jgi:hypothetical protein